MNLILVYYWWLYCLGVFGDFSNWIPVDIESSEFAESFGCRFIICEGVLGWEPLFEENIKALVDVIVQAL